MFENIVSVEEIGEQPTYDLEVESEFHNFYANDICVSNSHSVCYGFIAYQTLFLKYYYPAYFYSAMINIENNISKIQEIILDAKRNNITILPQSVKESEYLTRATDLKVIRLGFGMIKGMGESTINDCNSFRTFTTLSSLLKTEFKGINKTQFQNLIDLGAFDDYEIDRESIKSLAALYQDPKIPDWFTRKRQTLRLETLPKTLSDLFEPEECLKWALKAKQETEDAIWDEDFDENSTVVEKPWVVMLKYLLETYKIEKLDPKKYAKITNTTQKELLGFTLLDSGLKDVESTLKLKGLLPLKEFEDSSKKYYFVVDKIEKALTKTGKTYLKLTLDQGIKAKCWRNIDLEENSIYYGFFKKDNFGYTLSDRDCIKAM